MCRKVKVKVQLLSWTHRNTTLRHLQDCIHDVSKLVTIKMTICLWDSQKSQNLNLKQSPLKIGLLPQKETRKYSKYAFSECEQGYIPSLNFSHHANMKITLHIVSSELRKGRFPFSPHECVVFEPRAGQPTPWVHDSPSFPCVPNRRYQRPPVQQGSLFSGLL